MSDLPVPDIVQEWQAEEQRRRDALPAKKATVLAALKAANVASVTIEYDGSGDSGQTELITALDANGKEMPDGLESEFQPGTTLRQLIDDFAWDILDVHHSGFENNDGGFGKINIDVAAESVTLDHNDRVYEYLNTTTEV